MAELPVIEVREWGRPARRLTLSRPLLFGRECDGINLADGEVSRRHLRLVPTPTALSVVDLGSSNGSTVNGVPLAGRGTLSTGDVIRLGRTEIIVLHAPKPVTADQPPVAAVSHDPTRTMQAVKLVDVPVPAAAAATAVRSPGLRLAERALGIDPTGTRDLFPPYTELPHKISRQVWLAVRVGSALAYLAVVVTLFVRPAAGLFVFFHVIVPLWPALFFIAPGVWRNICPLSASNQLPRVAGFSRAATAPGWWTRNGFLIAAALFFGIAGARLVGLDRNGPAMGVVLAVIIASAFAGGFAFKGKSGWCSSICPLLPLQRTYGQTPYVTSPNSHCESCVGCAKNCYDFKPRAAWQADMADPEPSWSAPRVLFAAALPGFIIGFFAVHAQHDGTATEKYGVLALFVLVSVGLCYVLQAVTPLSQAMVTAVFAAVAINAYYWFSGPIITDSLRQITGVDAPWLRWPITVAIAALTLWWLARTRVSELQFAYVTGARAQPVLLNSPKMPATTTATGSGAETSAVRVRFESGSEPVGADIGMSLLDVAEKSGQAIEAGCRMGVCGADPVSIVDGMGCLSPAEADELKTLNRLGLGKSSRMACCARIQGGDVTVSLTPERADPTASRPVSYDRSIVSVVVIGNGIAGVTAADFLRRGHPDCEIHLVGAEPHGLYNRMGISRLVYGRSAMQGLYLLPEQWYDQHGVTAWLNTWATSIHLRSQMVRLGTGEALPYDRLILAMGSSAAVPDIPGLNRPGSVVLRSAADAMRIRGYVQERRARHAVVAGGGLLGLEAAYCLHQLGLRVTVLERGTRLLSKQIDARCSQIVAEHFARAGITIAHKAETAQVGGDPAVTGVVLKDGRILSCEVFLAATGIRPNIELARDAGLPVGKGVLVDDRMQTRIPGVYAAGDVAEHGGRVLGLWPVATEQAEAAAVNALGGDRDVPIETPPTILKGVDLELFSIGPVDPGPGDEVVVIDRSTVPSYRRLVVSRGRAVGATVLGHHPADLAAAQKAVRERRSVGPAALDVLRAGNWGILSDPDRLAY